MLTQGKLRAILSIVDKTVLESLCYTLVIDKGTYLEVIIETAIIKVYRTHRGYVIITNNTLAVNEPSLIKIYLHTHFEQVAQIGS